MRLNQCSHFSCHKYKSKMGIGRRCNERLLVFTNIVYMIIALGLGFFSYVWNSAIVDLPIIQGIFGCAVLLFFLAIVGFVAVSYGHKTFLLCYMISLVIIFVLQVGISSACLGVSIERQKRIVREGWEVAEEKGPPYDYIHISEIEFYCCGFNDSDFRRNSFDVPRNSTQFFELLYCIGKVEKCSNKTTPEQNVDNLDSWTNRETDLIFLESRLISNHYNKNNITSEDLICGTCQEPLEAQANRIYDVLGSSAMICAFIELLPIYFVYRAWKQELVINEETELTQQVNIDMTVWN